MEIETLTKANELVAKISKIECEIRNLESLEKYELLIKKVTGGTIAFEGLIPNELFEAFKNASINALKVRAFEFKKEFEAL